jgi:hypothetical protein
MKRLTALFVTGFLTISLASGCSTGSEPQELVLDVKHTPMPEYVLNSSPIVQETYLMAANYPEILASVPCYCNCNASAGHMNNLDCFVKDVGPENAVNEWDPHGIS